MTRIARCCCGDCSIAVEGEPVMNGVCHCANCKLRTGSGFGWSVYFPDDRITAISGALKVYVLDPVDAARQQRSFCPSCGTTLFWRGSSFPAHTGIAGGCFVDPPMEAPTFSASQNGRLDWIDLPDHWPKAP